MPGMGNILLRLFGRTKDFTKKPQNQLFALA